MKNKLDVGNQAHNDVLEKLLETVRQRFGYTVIDGSTVDLYEGDDYDHVIRMKVISVKKVKE